MTEGRSPILRGGGVICRGIRAEHVVKIYTRLAESLLVARAEHGNTK